MWEYSGVKYPSQVLKEELSSNEVGKVVRDLTSLTNDDEILMHVKCIHDLVVY
jgi:hypothetical protein